MKALVPIPLRSAHDAICHHLHGVIPKPVRGWTDFIVGITTYGQALFTSILAASKGRVPEKTFNRGAFLLTGIWAGTELLKMGSDLSGQQIRRIKLAAFAAAALGSRYIDKQVGHQNNYPSYQGKILKAAGGYIAFSLLWHGKKAF